MLPLATYVFFNKQNVWEVLDDICTFHLQLYNYLYQTVYSYALGVFGLPFENTQDNVLLEKRQYSYVWFVKFPV